MNVCDPPLVALLETESCLAQPHGAAWGLNALPHPILEGAAISNLLRGFLVLLNLQLQTHNALLELYKVVLDVLLRFGV